MHNSFPKETVVNGVQLPWDNLSHIVKNLVARNCLLLLDFLTFQLVLYLLTEVVVVEGLLMHSTNLYYFEFHFAQVMPY